VPPELDRGGQLAAFLEHLTDGRGCRFVDAEHGASMGGGTATGKRQPRKLAPAGNLETLPGPLAHLGRVTGMEIPGASAETGIRKMVLDRTHGLSVFMQISHGWMLHCGILIAPAYAHLCFIEAGHLARPKMENSDEKPDPCRFRRPELERRRCPRCQRRRFP
jgi:hypothetical protein